MVSLYKRASPSQAKILRIVEGAVLNAADAHGQPRDPWTARSIAKRAAGTLTAQWPEVLAANTRLPVAGNGAGVRCLACERRAHTARLRVRRQRVRTLNGAAERRASQLLRRSPLLLLCEQLKREMWALKNSGDSVHYEANKHLLRMIHALRIKIEIAKIT